MNLSVRIAHSIAEIGQEAWDVSSGGKPFQSYRWFAFCEKVMAGCPAIHILLSTQQEPLARGSFWLMRQEMLPVSSAPLQKISQWGLRKWPLCSCRVPVANRTGLVLPDSRVRESALRAILDEAQVFARQEKASFLLCDYLDPVCTPPLEWPGQFFWANVPDPSTVLILNRQGFDAYLSGLSKSARKDYRRHANHAASMGLEVTRHNSPASIEEAMVLIRNVERRHQGMPNPWAERILQYAQQVDSIWLEARSGGRLVGCGMLLRDGDAMMAALLGLDYGVDYVYFQIIYEAIRCAMESGVRLFYGGSGAYELKQRLGFQLEGNNHIAYAGMTPAFAWAGKLGARGTELSEA